MFDPSRFLALAGLAAAVTFLAAAGTASGAASASYSRDVFQICTGAVLFEGSHALGTTQGTLDAAADIRASTQRRLAEVAALPMPPSETRTIERWLAVEQRLADTYAEDLVQLHDLIAALSTPEQTLGASEVVRAAANASSPLRLAAGRLELKLELPDCTGE